MIVAILETLLFVINIYSWVVIAAVIMSWLVNFRVVNYSNQLVATIGDMLYRMTEPVFRPIRNMLPNMGGLDLSPLVVIIAIFFLQSFIGQMITSVGRL